MSSLPALPPSHLHIALRAFKGLGLLHFEVPRLGSLISALYQQQPLLEPPPSPEVLTVLHLLVACHRLRHQLSIKVRA